jgi:hypothetical protein
MNDPHVERLHYEIRSGAETSYRVPGAVGFANQLGHFEMREGMLAIQPLDHFTTEDDAREAIKPFLRAWEISTDLDTSLGSIHFEFHHTDVVDRSPPAVGESQSIEVKAADMVIVGNAASVQVTRTSYPPPPKSFNITVDVERAFKRWQDYQAGTEPLLGMAYFVLTIARAAAGDQAKAARVFDVEAPILRKIGELTSTRGDALTARKAPRGGQFTELTDLEKTWLEQAVRRLIIRFGERASGAVLGRLVMSDLPKL